MKTIYCVLVLILVIFKGVYGQTNIQIFNVSGKSQVFVREISTIILSGSQTGVTYELINSSDSVLMTLEGNGSPLKFTGVFTPGNFRVWGCKGDSRVEMGNVVTISYKDSFYNAGRFVPWTLEFSQEGETLESTFEPGAGLNYNNFFEYLRLCDQGLIEGWDASTFFIEIIGFTFYITTELNTSGNEKRSTMYVGNAKLELKQKPGVDNIGRVHIYPVEKFQEGRIVEIVIGGTQESVTYRLSSLTGGTAILKQDTGERLVFTVNQPGWYYLYGEYDMIGAELGVVKVIPLMNVHTLSGTGTTQGGQSATLTLSGSQASLEYELLRYGEVYTTKQGTGSPLSFTVNDPGVYTVRAGFMGEYTLMDGSASVDVTGDINITESENHEMCLTFLTPTTSGDSIKYMADINYLDGFNRVKQSVQVKAGSSHSDIIIPSVYGQQGWIEKEYLPYAKTGNNGAYDVNQASTANWNIYGTTEAAYAFKKIEYDNSPLNRIVKETGSGKNWHTSGKGTSSVYAANVANEVRRYIVGLDGTLTLNGTYPAGSLYKVIVTDEDSCRVETFTDKDGQVVLTVQVEGSNRLETYSVYDFRGLLRYVLSPEASLQLGTSINETILSRFAYRYDYDSQGRLIKKCLPGCAPVYMVYDQRDRLVMSQDGKQRTENTNKWSYSLYDSFDRMIETGEVILGSTMTHAALQTTVSASQNYTPSGTRMALQYMLYDTYTATTNVPVKAFSATAGYSTSYSSRVIGYVTSVKTLVLGTSTWLTATTYYDDRGRVIQSVRDNLHGRLSCIDMKYDFMGNVLQQRESHSITASQTDVLEKVNVYDDRGRLVSFTAKLNNGSPATENYTYDAVGRLVKQKHGNVEETMAYNTRGWLTSKESTPFKMKLYYESPVGGNAARWNGNISEWEWQHGTSSATMYGFTYDGVNRLTASTRKQKSGTSWVALTAGYLERGITYDRNGNIKTLQRTAGSATMVDNLSYTYTGNQLTTLTENVSGTPTGDIYVRGSTAATGTYIYDKNGNMINDSRRALNFSYNVLNLLSEVKAGTAVKAKYSYLANGTKLRVRDAGSNGFDYLGSLTYKSSSAGLQLETASFGSGVIRANVSAGDGTEVNYFLMDHLGSVRVIVDGSGVVKERNDYYLFGAKHVRSDYPQMGGNRYKYNGKEEQVTGDLDYLDYGWRMHDNALGRWSSMDKFSEMIPFVSGYAYSMNNPVNYRDILGLFPESPIELPEVEVVAPRRHAYFGGGYIPGWNDYTRQTEAYKEFERMQRIHSFNMLFREKSNFRTLMNYGVTPIGTYFSVKSGLRYTPEISVGSIKIGGYWQSAKGYYYSLQVLEKQANGKFLFGVNGLRKSLAWAKGMAEGSGYIGKGLGWLSVGYSGISFILNPNWEDGIDFVMGAAGTFYWPIGVTYFGGKLFYEGMSNYTRAMMENGFTPGVDDRNIWK